MGSRWISSLLRDSLESMKAYTFAAILFRFCGILLLLEGIYNFLRFLVTYFSVHSALANAESFDMFIRTFVSGLLVYFAAPFLAKIAAWKIQE